MSRALFFILLVPILVGCSGDKFKSKFSTYQDMKNAGYLANDWIPPCFPESSRKILDQHDPETNAAWVTFQLDEAGLAEFKALLKKPVPAPVYRAEGWGVPAWWPKEPKEPFYMLKCPGKYKPKYVTYVFVDDAKRQVYMWR